MERYPRRSTPGMLATTINALAVADVLEQKGVERAGADRHRDARHGRAVHPLQSHPAHGEGPGRRCSVCGTGNPFFSTDTAAVLRAAEIDADAILLAKNIDGVYSADPKKDPSAVKYDTITYDDMLAQHLQVMDSTATSLSMDNKIPVVLFALKDPENILRVDYGRENWNHCQGGTVI